MFFGSRFLLLALFMAVSSTAALVARAEDRELPNILWLTCEDLSPILGCDGDPLAITPNLDQLATESIRYTNAYANAPCCSPARSCIITGVYPSSLGTMHLRSVTPRPDFIRPFPEYLRELGYYCTNNVKEDYQFTTPKSTWDESSNTAHWRNKKDGQPFFAVFNHMVTHQSRVRWEGEKFAQATKDVRDDQRCDPNDVTLPPYYPDTPAIRRCVANLYELSTQMDYEVGQLLKQLEEDGLADDTIVFFYSDHGSGIPRGKRWLHDTGIKVPMMIRFPEKWAHLAPKQPGESTDQLVSFVDLAPTILSLVGVEIPDYMEGVAFLGDQAGEPREYIFACRDRVDEVQDLSRCVRDKRYKLIVNFYPHRSSMQYSTYSERSPIRQELRRLHAAGELEGPALDLVDGTKPFMEFYDTWEDPWELNNLVEYSELQENMIDENVRRLGIALAIWTDKRRDLAFLPESEMFSRCKEGETPYELREDAERYPSMDLLLSVVAQIHHEGVDSHFYADMSPELVAAKLRNANAVARYWLIIALHANTKDAKASLTCIHDMTTSDPSENVRIAAAEMCIDLDLGDSAQPLDTLADLLEHDDPWIALSAASAIQRVGSKCKPIEPKIREAIARKNAHFSKMYYNWALENALRRMGYDIPNTD